ncbi:MAG: type 4a pilus biogenesis protein PilO [Ferrimicrobium sp.]
MKTGARRMLWRAGIAVAVLLLLGGWYVGVWQHYSGEASQASATLASEQAQLVVEQAQLVTLTRDQRHARSLELSSAVLSRALPAQFSLSNFIAMIDSAASKSGLAIAQIAPANPGSTTTQLTSATQVVAPAGLHGVAFSLQTTGGYHQLLALFDAIDRLPELVEIDSIQLSVQATPPVGYSTATNGTALSLSLSGRVFYRA